MVGLVLSQKRKFRIAVAWAHDPNTLTALNKAVEAGFAEAILLGNSEVIQKVCRAEGLDYRRFSISECENEVSASIEAVRMAKDGQAGIIMKGLVGTDKFLKEVMDKKHGIISPGKVLSYVCAIEIPAYSKLLFVTDTAVIPFPTLTQKIAMAEYSLKMASRFGIARPKIALISASEKKSRHFESSDHYEVMCEMAKSGKFGECVMEGPLDIFLACDKKSSEIKGVNTQINGDSDILLFPSLESSNPFYKGLMLFAGGQLAGLLAGTEKPVIVMSRSESEKSKFYCISLACLMA